MIEQIVRNAALVYLLRRELPECLVLVLHPKGKSRDLDSASLSSPAGWTEWSIRWRCVKLREVPAEPLLNSADVEVVPWIPLTRFEGPPEPILRRCVERIEKDADPDERENLPAVIQVLRGLRYNDRGLLQLLGRPKVMIESPVIQELPAEHTLKTHREFIPRVLSARFGKSPETMFSPLQTINDTETFHELIDCLAVRPDLKSFQARFF